MIKHYWVCTECWTGHDKPVKVCSKCGSYDLAHETEEEILTCGCKFKSPDSNEVILCEECSKLPCHNLRK